MDSDLEAWRQNEIILKIFANIAKEYCIHICLKCKRFGHETTNHDAHVANNQTAKKRTPATTTSATSTDSCSERSEQRIDTYPKTPQTCANI